MIKIITQHVAIPKIENDISDEIEQAVKEIIKDVRNRGDEALIEYAKRFDGATLSKLKVSEDEIKEAYDRMDKEYLEVVKRATNNIMEFHMHQRDKGFITLQHGALLGQKVTPIERVGIYVPGGKAVYPSTVLMNVIPAKIAECPYISVVTPPRADGTIADEILACCYLLGVSAVYKIGGAGAIAALAYGTQSVEPVYKITGPGNAYVAAAKKQVFGTVGIDMIAGPSEILIIADNYANPAVVAADLLSQAEHDAMARCILATTSEKLANAVKEEIEVQIRELPKHDICRASIDNNGLIVICDKIEDCFDISNELAPEHLEIMLPDPVSFLPKVKSAGSIFLGEYTPEAIGDYYAGVNHTLPTNATSKFSSALSVETFLKKSTFVCYNEDALKASKDDVVLFATHEGLVAHAKSVLSRIEE
ncbi:MAG: histidinol dehydrogenase [Epulopiscium sp. Nele67-Bin002]|nr:MAG: histidinol dehydrogenase [Epulopiscium sp. Nuni2H_MBin001]OON90436.1 MAG: histidinol dehydrogenase [Epulopiscium sp. Nele67-Bin001]OON91816.1 MAG: histidinol dehydrogenase [Epulopiscium sp. Nele67-Bin002]